MFGAAGGLDCTTGFEAIDKQAACETAAAAVKRNIAVVQRSYAPGCSLDTNSGTVFFNTDLQAFGYCEKCRLLCTGAPAYFFESVAHALNGRAVCATRPPM